MGNTITGASQNNLNTICTAHLTNGFFGDYVVRWSIPRIILARERYMDSFNLVPLLLDDMQYVIPNIHGAKAKLLFDVFSKHCGSKINNNSNRAKTVDGLSLLSGITMNIGHAQLLDRLKFVFVLYDFDGTHQLNLSELTMMVRTTVGGMAALAELPCPGIEDLHRIAKHIFTAADTDHSQTISLDEFICWATADRAANWFFQTHQKTLDAQISLIQTNPNTYGNTDLSSFEDAEKQLLEQGSNVLDLKNHYLGDDGKLLVVAVAVVDVV